MSQREGVSVSGAPTYRSLLAGREFTALFSARVLSDWGDQLARVAIAALVLSRSGSALFTATVFAVSLLPQVFGQALLGPAADRLPRRALLVVCDLLRAALVVLLVVAVARDAPIGAFLALLFLVEVVGAPSFAASQTLVVDLFVDRSRYLRASNLIQVSLQLNQVLGVALGGLVAATVGPGRALELDALSFAVSALLLRLFVHARAAAAEGGVPGLAELGRDVREGLRYLRSDLPLRSLAWLAWLLLPAMLSPEAVALPLARHQGADTRVGGVLLAAAPFGLAVGAALLGRWPPVRQVNRMLTMAALLPVPLLAMGLDPPWPVAALLFALSGAFQAYLVPLMGTFTLLAPEHLRGRLNGVAGAGFALISALSFVVVGALADVTAPATAVLVAAATTLLVLAPLRRFWPARALADAAERAYR